MIFFFFFLHKNKVKNRNKWKKRWHFWLTTEDVEWHFCIFLCFRASAVEVMVDVDGKGEWRTCTDITGLRLPSGYYFGASSATGELSGLKPQQSPEGRWITRFECPEIKSKTWLSFLEKLFKVVSLLELSLVCVDNHDIISMKLYQLTNEPTSEEAEEEEEVTIPRVDNMEQFQGICFCSSWSHFFFVLNNLDFCRMISATQMFFLPDKIFNFLLATEIQWHLC